MKKLTLLVDDKMEKELAELKSRMFSDNLSYIIRYSVHQFFLNGIISNEINAVTSTPSVNLPGMTERVIRSQMDRFNLSADEYITIVRQVVDGFASSGSAIKNPEAAIFGACRRYAKKRDEQPAAQSQEEDVYALQERLG